MSTLPTKLLSRYRVDRATGQTLDGSTELVVLVLKAHDAPELAVAMSRTDAVIIAQKMMAAATDAQTEAVRKGD